MSALAQIHKGRTNMWKLALLHILIEPGFNVRSIDYSQDPEVVAKLDPELEPLARSIALHGIRIPCSGAMVDGKFRITAGHRRTCAVRVAIARGWLAPDDPRALIPVLPEPQRYTEDARLLDHLTLNGGRPLTIAEQATVFVRLMEDHGYDEAKLAEKTAHSITHIRNCLLLIKGAHPQLLTAIARDEIRATTVVELVRDLRDPAEQMTVFVAALVLSDGNRVLPKHLQRVMDQRKRGAAVTAEEEELIEKALEIMRVLGAASASIFQRRLGLGYTQATRLLDILEERGIVGPGDAGKPREILIALDAPAHDAVDGIAPSIPSGDDESSLDPNEDQNTHSESSSFEPSAPLCGNSTPDTAVTNGDGQFISGWTDVPVDLPHPKVKATLHLVEERGLHYCGFTLKWPARAKGDGYLHEKPQRIDGCKTRPLAILAALQRIQGELEGREFPKHPEVMAAIDRMIATVGESINPEPHKPSTAGTPAATEPSKDGRVRVGIEEMLHFVKVAEQGGNSGSTPAEKIAHRLAQSFRKIGDDICLLDADAVSGACCLLTLMAGPWKTDADKTAIYTLLTRAAQ